MKKVSNLTLAQRFPLSRSPASGVSYVVKIAGLPSNSACRWKMTSGQKCVLRRRPLLQEELATQAIRLSGA